VYFGTEGYFPFKTHHPKFKRGAPAWRAPGCGHVIAQTLNFARAFLLQRTLLRAQKRNAKCLPNHACRHCRIKNSPPSVPLYNALAVTARTMTVYTAHLAKPKRIVKCCWPK